MPSSMIRRLTRRRAVLWSAAALAAAMIGIVVAMSAGGSRPSVNGVEFTQQEMSIASDRAARSGAGDADAAAAVDVLRDDLALFAVAEGLGASDVGRPSDILGLLDQVNDERAKAAEAGEVLYGPVAYDLPSFYGKSLTDIRQAAVSRLEAEPGLVISDADVRDRFQTESDQWAEAATTYRLTRVVNPGGVDASASIADVTALADGGWSSIVAGSRSEPVTLTAEQLAAGALSPDVTAMIAAAMDGSVIGPTTFQGAWAFYRLESRDVDEDAAFDHYRGRIRSALVQERLDALIEDARSAQDVRIP